MTIPQDVLEKWRLLNSPGDAKKMAEKIEKGYPEIFNRALREGKCNDDVFKVLKTYYKQKAKVLKSVL